MKYGVKIAFFDTKPYDRLYFEEYNNDYGFDIKFFVNKLNSETVHMAEGYDVVCIFVNDQITDDVIEQLHSFGVQLIALRCAGYNNVEMKTLYGKIHAVRVPAYSPYSVAEHAVALLMSLNRKTHRAYYRVRDNNFQINGLLGFDIHGKTVGVIGTGQIGQKFIQIMRGFGAEVIAYDPYPNYGLARQLDFEFATINDILAQSDIISLHCPLTADTNHMINGDAVSRMKKGVFILNTSRGALIDTNALIDGLKSGKIGAAGLDVYEEEGEYFFEDFSDSVVVDDTLARLLSFNNVLITSHQGFFTEEALQNIARITLDNIVDFIHNRKLENEICYKCGTGTCPKKGNIINRCF